jgi:hypothetical protein
MSDEEQWVPGSKSELISAIEREWKSLMDVVAKLAEVRMTTPDAGGWSPKDNLAHLAEWLKTRPSDAFFEKTLRAIRAMLQARPSDERDASRRDLLAYCTAIASASGGILGFGKVSEDERKLLTRITSELERAHGEAAERAVAPLPEPS